MLRLVQLLFIIIALAFVAVAINNKTNLSNTLSNFVLQTQQSVENISKSQTVTDTETKVLAGGLDTPWAMAILPDTSILLTERPGRVRAISSDGKLVKDPVVVISSVKELGEGGLLGIALHPEFETNHFVYLYYTYSSLGNNTLNRVVRMTFENNALTNETTIVDKIPGASNHNGGRIKFGPDKLLYIGTGDAENPSQAQDKNTLGGKILRVKDDGSIPSGNPFNNLVYSFGHRNVQGLAWDNEGNLYATEHGRSGVQSGLDEVNSIKPGNNYGWPTIQGNETKEGMQTPLRNSGNTTWAPSGLAYYNGSLYFVGLRGQSLYQAQLKDGQITNLTNHLEKIYGRLREVVQGSDNLLYISTSNQDGRGTAATSDDRVIRINPASL